VPDEKDAATVIIKNLGRVVAEIRTAKGVSQTSLAKIMGIPVQQISGIETGTGNPTLRSITAFAVALEVEVIDLLKKPTGGKSKLGPGRKKKALG